MAWNKAQRRISANKTDVYRVRDTAGQLLYVGASVNVFRRMPQHRPYAAWWEASDTMTVDQYPTRRIARYVEAVAIRDESPVHNVTHEWSELRKSIPEDLTPVETFEMWRDGDRWWIDG